MKVNEILNEIGFLNRAKSALKPMWASNVAASVKGAVAGVKTLASTGSKSAANADKAYTKLAANAKATASKLAPRAWDTWVKNARNPKNNPEKSESPETNRAAFIKWAREYTNRHVKKDEFDGIAEKHFPGINLSENTINELKYDAAGNIEYEPTGFDPPSPPEVIPPEPTPADALLDKNAAYQFLVAVLTEYIINKDSENTADAGNWTPTPDPDGRVDPNSKNGTLAYGGRKFTRNISDPKKVWISATGETVPTTGWLSLDQKAWAAGAKYPNLNTDPAQPYKV
jgi:hypothetical protein